MQPFLVITLVILMFCELHADLTTFFALRLCVLFVTVRVFHGELARDRPPVRHLTEFYLMISVGSALGGVFKTLIALASVAEYPLVLALASGSIWAVFARTAGSLGPLRADERGRPPVTRGRVGVWTDDFADVLGVYRWR